MFINRELVDQIAYPHIIARGKKYFDQGRVVVDERTDTSVLARVRGSHWYSVEMSYVKGEFESSCTCPYDGGDVCKHIVAVMFSLMDAVDSGPSRAVNSLHMRSLQAHKAKAKQVPWRKTVKALLPQRFDPFPRSTPQKPWRLAYSLLISGADRQIVPLRIRQLKGGSDATPTLLKQFDANDGIHFDLADRVIIQRIEHGFHSYVAEDTVGRGDRSDAFMHGFRDHWYGRKSDWNDVLLFLQGKELYVQVDGNLMGKRISVHAEQARFHVAIRETSGGIVLQPEVERNGSVSMLPEDIIILTKDPLWILSSHEVFSIQGVRGDELAVFKQGKMHVTIPSEGSESFLKKMLPPLVERYEIRSELRRMRSVHADPVPRVYLSERDGGLVAEIRFAYDGVEVEVDSTARPAVSGRREPAKAHLVRRGEETIHVTRKHDLETHHLARTSGFSLRYHDRENDPAAFVPTVPPLEWVLNVLPKLQEGGFEVFGQEGLQAHNLRQDLPTMRLDITSGMDWFDLSVDVQFAGTEASLAEFVRAVVNKSRFVRLGDGSVGVLPQEWIDRFGSMLALFEPEENRLRFSRIHVGLVDALLDGTEVNSDAAFKELRKKFQSFRNIESVKLPVSFNGELRPYQKAGYDWLHFLRQFGVGGILADDMGLGKTVQTLALLQQQYESGETKPSLIVVPSSPLFNWRKEAARFTPALRVAVYSGTDRRKQLGVLGSCNILLTSYGILRRDIEMLRKMEFLYVVLDESQNIKNPHSVNAKSARLLRARHKLALSGTPVENNLMELWSQFTFLNPGMLGSERAFATHFANPIERQGNEGVSESLKRIIFPFILRRTKDIVASELPPKVETVTYCDMDPAQRSAYDHWREYYRRAIQQSIETVGFSQSKMKVLEGLMKLRQVCCHPSLVDAKYAGSSGKFDAFVEMVDDILAGGHKVLVFSQFVRLLTVLRQHFDNTGVAYEYLDGRTRDRESRVERFQNDASLKIFLISLKAGGTGLNLTAADYVIHYDPWWNPAVEMQATDRTHRIGQTKHVFAYKLITRNSVEEKVLALQEKKKELVRNIITTDSGFMKSLTREDVEVLFK